jgi:hypothetical protein
MTAHRDEQRPLDKGKRTIKSNRRVLGLRPARLVLFLSRPEARAWQPSQIGGVCSATHAHVAGTAGDKWLLRGNFWGEHVESARRFTHEAAWTPSDHCHSCLSRSPRPISVWPVCRTLNPMRRWFARNRPQAIGVALLRATSASRLDPAIATFPQQPRRFPPNRPKLCTGPADARLWDPALSVLCSARHGPFLAPLGPPLGLSPSAWQSAARPARWPGRGCFAKSRK